MAVDSRKKPKRSRITGPRKDRKKFENTSSQQPSVNALKSKIRDVSRVLEHSDRLPPGVRIEKERALVGYRQDLDAALKSKRRQQMIEKYHKVRFFERQKATRHLKQVRARYEEAEPDSEPSRSLQKKAHEAEVDLNYALFYPLDEKYISLFPKSSSKEPNDTTSASKPPMWETIEKCMLEGTLEKLREGRLNVKVESCGVTSIEHNSSRQKFSKQPTKARERTQQGEVEDEESDGGFFET